MRIRTIKPEFFKHDELAALPPLARLLFIGLWCIADREGRLEDRPLRIKAEVLPYEEAPVDPLLNTLRDAGFIRRYSVDGVKVIDIPNFSKHQRITGKEAETQSKYPQYPDVPILTKAKRNRGSTGETPGKEPGSTGETPETTGREGKGKEGEGKGIHTPSPPAPGGVEAPPPPQPPPLTALTVYEAYPRKQGRADALKAIEKAVARGNTLEQLHERTLAYAKATAAWDEADRQYIPHAATWFNGDRFDDDPTTWVRHEKINPFQERTPDYTKSFFDGTGFEEQK